MGREVAVAGKKRRRNVPLYVWVSPEELQAIKDRMEQTGIRNMSAYVRKMALNGFFSISKSNCFVINPRNVRKIIISIIAG